MYFRSIPLLGLDDICRFWQYVVRKEKEECWIWTGACVQGGCSKRLKRPCLRIGGTSYIATRIAWKIEFNEDPGQYLLCHTCSPKDFNTPQLCVNPYHLWQGTHGEHQRDMHLKGERQGNYALAPWEKTCAQLKSEKTLQFSSTCS